MLSHHTYSSNHYPSWFGSKSFIFQLSPSQFTRFLLIHIPAVAFPVYPARFPIIASSHIFYLSTSSLSSYQISGYSLCISCLSRPLLKIATWRYWFRLSRYVYDGNRSFTPILRQRRWSLMYDVYWLDLMMVNSQQDRNTWTRFRVRIVLFLLNNE